MRGERNRTEQQGYYPIFCNKSAFELLNIQLHEKWHDDVIMTKLGVISVSVFD